MSVVLFTALLYGCFVLANGIQSEATFCPYTPSGLVMFDFILPPPPSRKVSWSSPSLEELYDGLELKPLIAPLKMPEPNWIMGKETNCEECSLCGNNLDIYLERMNVDGKIQVYGDIVRGKCFFDADVKTDALVHSAIRVFDILNRVHDVLYAFGFNEEAGNFQEDNGSNGGLGGDRVLVKVHERRTASARPQVEDGKRVGIEFGYAPVPATLSETSTHTASDPDIPIHEYMHLVFSRLVKPDKTLSDEHQIHALDEGLADVLVLLLRADHSEYQIGKYALNNLLIGGRIVQYSLGIMPTNVLSFGSERSNHANIPELKYAFGQIIAQIFFRSAEDVDHYLPAALCDTNRCGRALMLHLLLDMLPRLGSRGVELSRIRECTLVSLLQLWLKPLKKLGVDKQSFAAIYNVLDEQFALRGVGKNAVPAADHTIFSYHPAHCIDGVCGLTDFLPQPVNVQQNEEIKNLIFTIHRNSERCSKLN
eukprot:GILK01009893.1.p1 GENE.GILK01009893.1~~GILK01009893.1.p1  ORF type:complete len:490 (-),score=55.28 GILK01009893.1:172-1611(-)